MSSSVYPYLDVKDLTAALVLGVDVLGWALLLVLGAGCGVLGCLTAVICVALEEKLLDRGRICRATPTTNKKITQLNTISGSVSELVGD